jgi:hypothetical protein
MRGPQEKADAVPPAHRVPIAVPAGEEFKIRGNQQVSELRPEYDHARGSVTRWLNQKT